VGEHVVLVLRAAQNPGSRCDDGGGRDRSGYLGDVGVDGFVVGDAVRCVADLLMWPRGSGEESGDAEHGVGPKHSSFGVQEIVVERREIKKKTPYATLGTGWCA